MKYRLLLFVTYLVLLSFIGTAVCFSQYRTRTYGTGQTNAALAVIDYFPVSATINGVSLTNVGNGISITDVKPGDVLVCNFEIRNYKGTNINEVLLKYHIKATFSPDPETLPLSYTITPASSYPSVGGDWSYLYYGSEQTHSYTLKVTWLTGENDDKYLNRHQIINIAVDAQQMDTTP